MPDEQVSEDRLAPSGKGRSTVRGDVPDTVQRRYYTDGRGGDGLGFYVDARVQTPAFRDRGRELVAARADPNAIRDMTAIAQHRGWAIVTARGSTDFRREAWLVGRSMGLEVRGFRATERDLQELERRQVRTRQEDRREAREERRDDRRNHGRDEREARVEMRENAAANRQLRVIDAVVRARVSNPERQEQIMAAAKDRIADWLERGARFADLRSDRPSSRDRQRAR
jgi:hypothetical protein